jgi:predicted DNA-binding transcriptional regulator AlpA
MAEQVLLTEKDVARIVCMSVQTVRRWRLQKAGPYYIKLGGSVRYRPEDVQEFIRQRPAVNATGFE